MAYVIAEPCIGTKDSACVDACPVDCIHPKKDEGGYGEAETGEVGRVANPSYDRDCPGGRRRPTMTMEACVAAALTIGHSSFANDE